MKRVVLITILFLLVIPLVAAQQFVFLDLAGAYEVYWQWFDLAIYVIIFTSLAFYVFVEKMHMHKGVSVGIGLALGLSMLMLEVYAGYRLILLSPYAALVIALALWIMLWMAANAAEMGLGGKDKPAYSWIWGILSFIFAMAMLSAMLRAATVHGLILGPLQSLLDFFTTDFITGLMNVFFLILLFYGLVSLVITNFPRLKGGISAPGGSMPSVGSGGGGSTSPAFEAARRDIDSLRSEVKKMSEELRANTSVRLGELRTRTGQLERDIRSLLERIAALQEFLNTFSANLTEVSVTCTALANDIPRLGKISDRYKNWLLSAFKSIRDSKESARKALDALQAHINTSKSDFTEFKKRFDNVVSAIGDSRKRLDSAGKSIAEGKLSPEIVARMRPEYEEMRIRVYELERLQKDLLTQVAKVEDAQKGIEAQQPVINQAKEQLTASLDKIEDALENRVVAFELQVNRAADGLREAADAAHAAGVAVVQTQDALRILGMHARRPDESIVEMKLDEERAEHELNDLASRLAALEGELSKAEETIIQEETTEEKPPVYQADITLNEVVKSMSRLAGKLKDLKSLNAKHINKISKWKKTKDAEEAIKEFKLMLNVVKEELANDKTELELSIAENEKIVMATPARKKELADMVAEEVRILTLEKEIDTIIRTYLQDVDKRLAELTLQPKVVQQLQSEMRDTILSIQGTLDSYIEKVELRAAELKKNAGI